MRIPSDQPAVGHAKTAPGAAHVQAW
jgi:hypothetical protein